MENKEKLEHKRHTLAHLLAAAVKELYPEAKPTLGPAIDTGFYYDFDNLKDADLKELQRVMRKLLPKWTEFAHQGVSVEEAKKLFKGNQYKAELIDEIAARGETITLYTCGDFTDLCRGGHSENPSKEIESRAFKLTHLAGAYWRGDEKNPMLTRIYGLAFDTEAELDAYEAQQEEAKKRDHKKLGKELKLFTFSDLVGKGLPLFLPKGTFLRERLEAFITEKKKILGYQFVSIPHIAKRELYEKSGHMGKYDAMMPVMTDNDGDQYVMKAMNCPHHFELYNAEPHSYRDLPLRYAENTAVYRNEKSGELQGLTRVKSLTQDDTHHFVRYEQIKSEIEMVLGLMKDVYETFGFTNYKVQISIRDQKNKEKYFGDDILWSTSEQILIDAVEQWGVPFIVAEGEAAFYGPKIDIMVVDSIGREWQLTTVQLDFNQPENFNLVYTGEDGKEHKVAVLHVAILGSTERFLGILIEHFAGAFPTWLSPQQVHILPISDKHEEYGKEILALLQKEGIRAELDASNETIGKKIRNWKLEKIPYAIVIGDNEARDHNITLETRNGDKHVLTLEAFAQKIVKEVSDRSPSLSI